MQSSSTPRFAILSPAGAAPLKEASGRALCSRRPPHDPEGITMTGPIFDTSVLSKELHDHLQEEVDCLTYDGSLHTTKCIAVSRVGKPTRAARILLLDDMLGCCRHHLLKDAPDGVFELANVILNLPEGPCGDPRAATQMRAGLLELMDLEQVSALLPQVEALIEVASREVEAWKHSSEADQLLDEWGSLMSFPPLTVEEAEDWVPYEDDVAGRIIDEDDSSLPDGLADHHARRTRKPGQLLVRTLGEASELFDYSWLDGAAEKHCLGRRVMVLPRALEVGLRRSPKVSSTAVIRATDTSGVLETAAKLLDEGEGGAAEALKVARALA
jgi:hypothetical protein